MFQIQGKKKQRIIAKNNRNQIKNTQGNYGSKITFLNAIKLPDTGKSPVNMIKRQAGAKTMPFS